MSHKTAMWQVYRFGDHQVVIIQQWFDPFGRPMIRIAAHLDGHLIAEGMPEEKFLAEAIFVASRSAEIVEGEN